MVGPYGMTTLNFIQRGSAFRRDDHELGSAVMGIVLIANVPFGHQGIGYLLYRLPRQPHFAGHIRDGDRSVFDHTKHLPTGTAESHGLSQSIPGIEQLAVEAEYFNDEIGKSAAFGR